MCVRVSCLCVCFFPNETSFWETPLRIKEKASDRWENWISGPNPAAVSWWGGCFFPGEKISANNFGIICRNYLPISFWARVGSGQMISANNSEIICRNHLPKKQHTHTPAPKFCSRIWAGNLISPPVTSFLFDP